MALATRRRPGRPRGSRNKPKPPVATATPQPVPQPAPIETPETLVTAEPTFDPATFTGGHDAAIGDPPPAPEPDTPPEPEPEPRARRGRPPRSGINVSGMEQILLGIHTTLFAATQVPEFELSQEEARSIAEAYTEMCRHYPAWNIDPKHAAVVNFGTTLSIVYGSRIIAFRARQQATRRQAPPAIVPTVATPPPAPPGAPPAMMQDQINGMPPPQAPPPPVATAEIRTGEIPGVGSIVFGEDHPLISGRRQ